MKHLFFLLVGLLAFYEMMKALNCKRVYSCIYEYRHLPKEKIKAYLKEHPMLLLMSVLDTFGWITLMAGLMTSQWVLFLAVIALSLSRFQRLGSWAVCIDSIIIVEKKHDRRYKRRVDNCEAFSSFPISIRQQNYRSNYKGVCLRYARCSSWYPSWS